MQARQKYSENRIRLEQNQMREKKWKRLILEKAA